MRKFIGLSLLCAASANAAQPSSQTISIELPKSDFSFHEIAAPPARATESKFEFQLSFSGPAAVDFGSRVAGTSAFAPVFPTAGVFYNRRLGSVRWGEIGIRSGVEYATLSREGLVSYGVVSREESQLLQWINLHLELNFRPHSLRYKSFATEFGAALVPAFAVSARSPLSYSESALGWGFEAGARFSLALPMLDQTISGAELTFGASRRLGKSGPFQFASTLFHAGVRVEI